jgi:tetratricopeptide (TPR) repeat protein
MPQSLKAGEMTTIALYRFRCRWFALMTVVGLMSHVEQAVAQASDAALEHCRETVRRPFVQNCVKTGQGDRETCRELVRPQVRECVQKAAGAAKGGEARGAGASGGKTGQTAQGSPALPFIGRARGLVEQGKFQAAVSELDQAIKLDPNFAQAFAWRGRAYNLLGLYPQALSDLNEALEIDQKNILALLNRGYVRYALKDNGGGLADLNTVTELDPSNPGAFASRALIYSDMGEQDRALTELSKSAQLGPNYAPAYGNLGFVDNKLQQYDKAIVDYTKALKISPYIANYLSGRGFAYFKLGEQNLALADLNAALGINPKSSRGLAIRGRIYLDQGKYDAAIRDFSDVLSFEPRNVVALVQRARAYELSRNLDGARADFQAALDILPAHGVAAAGRERIEAKIAAASGSRRSVADHAGVRVALVIGNSHYKAVGLLANPERDAKLIADTLGRSGFEKVHLMIDATRGGLAGALQSFAAEAANADWAVIYYAGHGLEVDGSNYVVPVDVNYQSDADVPTQSIALDQILNSVSSASKLRLVILDACRDNPFAATLSRGEASAVGRGLARIEPESGTLVAFATKHGHFATDGKGANSPFATALVDRMPTPGLEINQLFRLVHDDVYASTDREQEPFTYGQLSAAGLYFRAP